ncbi:MAG TPA: rhomboid family intramembrane serine protease [Gemmatimonadaceae bacterium]|nr:rhomboid family intramembrane serine protease [Gemmatimonadaceae bacterium]
MTRSLKLQATLLGAAVALMWLAFAATVLTGGALLSLGIIPRTAIGLRGIVFAPMLHGSLAHLVANSLPFVILGWLVMARDQRHFGTVTLYSLIGSGLAAWLLGASGSVHIGASGLIFGYLGFLMLSGWFARSFLSIVISLLVTITWGSIVLGVVPGQAGISWQAHFGGFLAGILAARRFKASR